MNLDKLKEIDDFFKKMDNFRSIFNLDMKDFLYYILSDDDIFINLYYHFPFEILEKYVSKIYLTKRYLDLKEKGLL